MAIKSYSLDDYIKYREPYLGSLMSLGYCYLHLGELDEAKKYFNKVLKISNKDQYELTFLVESSVTLALIESCQKATNLNYINEKLNLVFDEQIIDYEHINIYCTAYRLSFGALTYKNIGEKQKAQDKVDQIFSLSKNKVKNYIYKQVKGNAHMIKAELYRIEKDFNKAINHHQKSIEILDKIGAKCDLAEGYFQLGLTYQQMEEQGNAQKYFEEAIKLWSPEQINAPRQIERVRTKIVT